jgi:hypothetical protein
MGVEIPDTKRLESPPDDVVWGDVHMPWPKTPPFPFTCYFRRREVCIGCSFISTTKCFERSDMPRDGHRLLVQPFLRTNSKIEKCVGYVPLQPRYRGFRCQCTSYAACKYTSSPAKQALAYSYTREPFRVSRLPHMGTFQMDKRSEQKLRLWSTFAARYSDTRSVDPALFIAEVVLTASRSAPHQGTDRLDRLQQQP